MPNTNANGFSKSRTMGRSSPVAAALKTDTRAVSTEAIAARAYEKFLGRESLHGHDEEDWLAAETELLAKQIPL